jgi:histidinol-phosphate aminotransferase
MADFEHLVRASIKSLTPYQAGKPIEEVQRELGLAHVVKLASNEYPEGPFPEVLAALAAELPRLNRYPDSAGYELTHAVSEALGLPVRELFFGNGNNEILELLVHLLVEPGSQAVYAHPSFPIYGLICRSHFDCGVSVPCRPDYVHDLPAMAAAVTERTRLVFICNPNNPTGTYVTRSELVHFLERIPAQVVVALDEAYMEFAVADDFPDFFELRGRFPNLASLRTFSKAYSLAGLRLGYLIGDERLVNLLHRVRQPFNVNRLSQVAAVTAVRHKERVAERRRLNRTRLERLARAMELLGCTVLPSQANFLLAFSPRPVPELFQRLLREGVIVRPTEPFGMPPGSFRVSVGSDEENARFLAALEKVLALEGAV